MLVSSHLLKNVMVFELSHSMNRLIFDELQARIILHESGRSVFIFYWSERINKVLPQKKWRMKYSCMG